MAKVAKMILRLIPIAQAIPRRTLVRRVEVLSTLRKHGTSRFVTRPSRGDALHHCLGSGYDLILEVSTAPHISARFHQ
jgi:hypothetical protein